MIVNKDNLYKFYSINQLKNGEHWITDNAVDKNEFTTVKENEDNYKVCKVDMSIDWCDWKQDNEHIILDYFNNKYNK